MREWSGSSSDAHDVVVVGSGAIALTAALTGALDAFGEPIPGLFAAGNTTAHLMGPGYAGAGATLGPGMTMAMIAGRTCARAPAQLTTRA